MPVVILLHNGARHVSAGLVLKHDAFGGGEGGLGVGRGGARGGNELVVGVLVCIGVGFRV